MSGSLYDFEAGILPGTTGQLDPWAPGAAGSSGVALGTGGGQQGVRHVDTSVITQPIMAVWKWLQKPITTPLAPTDIFVLVGSVVIAWLLWSLILYHVRIAAEAI